MHGIHLPKNQMGRMMTQSRYFIALEATMESFEIDVIKWGIGRIRDADQQKHGFINSIQTRTIVLIAIHAIHKNHKHSEL